ncbi:MAG TPA: DedA family protein [Terriglobales bacterium]|jgi:membrane-associated protein|nr:DedA family protein [Terriglobales bacterium]
MGERLFELLRHFFNHFGYWTVAIALLLENAGLPVPGETILLFASFLAYSQRHLHLPYIILVGIFAATLGDNIGYWIGYRGGRRMLERYQHIFHIRQKTLERGERLFAKYGSHTIFFARFIVGMRIIAGPLAGVLRMPWRSFALFNFLGATLWVTTISLIGYFFGSEWHDLLRIMKRVNVGIFIAAAVVAVFLYWRYRRRRAAGAAAGEDD